MSSRKPDKYVREKNIEQPVIAYAKACGGDNIEVVKMNLLGNRSFPDRMFLFGDGKEGGKLMFIEFKRPGEKPTPLQQAKIDKLRRMGFDVFVCDDVAKGKAMVEGLWATDPPKNSHADVLRDIVLGMVQSKTKEKLKALEVELRKKEGKFDVGEALDKAFKRGFEKKRRL